MLKNYIKITIRNLVRQRLYSVINILGLAIGICCSILILLWVQDELNFNQFHENIDHIYRVNKKYMIGINTDYNPSTPYPLAQTAKFNFAGIKEVTKFSRRRTIVKYGENVFTEKRVCLTDTAFFRVFSLNFVKGSPDRVLLNPNSIIISEDIANKYFGNAEPLGKTLLIDNSNEFIVSGVIQNIPANSDIKYEIFIPLSYIMRDDDADNWHSHWLSTYVMLQDGSNPVDIEKKLSGLIKKYLPEEEISLVLQPLKDMHLYSIDGQMAGMKYVYFFSIIAFFILIIACINFMNLSTARSIKRAKETGLRKVMGAKKSQIVRQFLGESIIYTLIALIVAFLLVEIIRPVFNDLTNKNLELNYFNFQHVTGIALIVIFTGLISGSYPALFLSSFQPLRVLRANFNSRGKSRSGFRKLLVVIQFSLSIILMIGTGIIYSQLEYIQNKNLGFDKNNIIYLAQNRKLNNNFDIIKRELLAHPNILSITRASEPPTETWSIVRGITWEGKETQEGAAFAFAAVDYDYFETFDMDIVAGRSFSKRHPIDSVNYIFNQKAIAVMDLKAPIGKNFSLDEDEDGSIIGVVDDFHFLPFTYEIEPMILTMNPDYYRYMLIKIDSRNIESSLNHLESVWNKILPEFPFEYNFLDDQFDDIYKTEQRSGQIFSYFVILAIFISCLGLFGLASFTVEQRTKEMGIHKVLGASVLDVLYLLAKDFARWILLANLIAWPVAWYAMNTWLENFIYRTDIDILIFIVSGVLALLIAMITISSQAIKAAISNPIDSLNYE